MNIVAAQPEIHENLRVRIAEILYCQPEEVGDDATFQDLGLDSVLGADLIEHINSVYGLQEEVEAVYQKSTLAQLSTYVAEQVSAKAGHGSPG